MKSSKFLTFTSLLLCIMILFTSCSSVGNISRLLIDDYEEESSKPYVSGAEVTNLNDASYSNSRGNLVLFTKYATDGREYFVYNLDTHQIIWSQSESSHLSLSVSFYSAYVDYHSVAFFTVHETVTEAESECTTTLYSADGSKISSVDSSYSPTCVEDLIYFDGKMYRVYGNGKISSAFDYSPLARIPSINSKHKDIYYQLNDDMIQTYDSKLKPLAKYRIPECSNCEFVLLGDGNVLVQYIYEADPMSNDYTVIIEGEKYDVITKIINAKNGNEKTVKCNYIIRYANINYDYAGIDSEKTPVIGGVYVIEDRRIAEEKVVTIDNSGKASALGSLDNDRITSLSFFAKNRWIIDTESGSKYLVDQKCEIIGEVTKADRYGEFFVSDGKIYDADLKEVYDLASKKQSINKSIGASILLNGEDGEVTLLTKKGATELIAKDSDKYLVTASAYDGYIIVRNDDTSTFEIYSILGSMICEVKNVHSTVNFIHSTNNSLLLQFRNKSDSSLVYYVLSK